MTMRREVTERGTDSIMNLRVEIGFEIARTDGLTNAGEVRYLYEVPKVYAEVKRSFHGTL